MGYVRVDGSELFPDEGKECDLMPTFAPMSLVEQLKAYGKQAPRAKPAQTAAAKLASAGQKTIAQMMAFVKQAKAARGME